MNADGARHVLKTYAAYRSQRDEAIDTLKRDGATIAEIVRLSGLSRTGVDKILARETEHRDQNGEQK